MLIISKSSYWNFDMLLAQKERLLSVAYLKWVWFSNNVIFSPVIANLGIICLCSLHNSILNMDNSNCIFIKSSKILYKMDMFVCCKALIQIMKHIAYSSWYHFIKFESCACVSRNISYRDGFSGNWKGKASRILKINT